MNTTSPSLTHFLFKRFGLVMGAAAMIFSAITLTSIWRSHVHAIGESSRYTAQFVAATVAEDLSSGSLNQLQSHVELIPTDTLVGSICLFGSAGELVAAYGPSTCAAEHPSDAANHFYASHPVRWQGQRVGNVVITVPWSVARVRVLEAMLPTGLLLLAGFVLTLIALRHLSGKTSRTVDQFVTQLRQDDKPLLQPSDDLSLREVDNLASAVNQRLEQLIDARDQAERQALHRESSEAAERRSRQLLRNIIDLVPYAIFAQHRDGSLIFANQATADLYGKSMEQLMDPAYQRSAQPDDGVLFASDAPEQTQLVFGPERRRLEVIRRHIEDRRAMVVVAIDVTRSHQLQEQLEFSQRLEVIGTLAGGIAHDFNNLLTPILGYASILVDQNLPADAHSKIEQIESAAFKARDVVQQMLHFSRQSATEHQPVDLCALLDDVCSLMRVSAPATAKITVEAEPLTTVLADPGQLEQVLVNLCTNAVQALNHRDGWIRIRAQMSSAPPATLDLPAGRYVTIEVADSGPGIDPDVMRHVFEPFFTTKNVGEGSGLGLAVAHGIARNHGGDLVVRNDPDAGAVFTVILPERPAVNRGAQAPLAEPADTAHPPARKTARPLA